MTHSANIRQKISLLLFFATLGLNSQVYEKSIVLHGDTITFPITLINGYPFVSATVNGTAGKFMFDTGFGTSVMLNDDFIQLPLKKPKGNGVVGSGQSFRTNMNDNISEITFSNGISYKKLTSIISGNYGFIQNVLTPDFLGFIGYDFFKEYIFKIDYLHHKITFYKNAGETRISGDILKNEKILAVLTFEIRNRPNIPIVKFKIKGVDVMGVFDTGQNGSLQLDTESAQMLTQENIVTKSGIDSNGDTLLNITNIEICDKLTITLKGIEYAELNSTKVARRELGISEPNLMSIGYRFLAQHKTVWDYAQKKIYILEY
ncbi:hypothetical protein EG349_01190 [Chryseobacterium shandongense]|uniref:Aspartyl protease n=1 Tax=Chryseobacterium shandongense TaxID=1493872 RepID=A0AAD0YF32_9FLAO|nr:hypothetical protein [Chryseobacterium shandongense]AZA85501.1 hypothetical protein EG349_01190 [Chryseobacterium shandongense]AZA97673.1 hypothetical protein EG353_20005 [Chryseobacterium shandongense]